MRPADAHLNPQEFELVLFGLADSGTSNTGNSEAFEAQQHLAQDVPMEEEEALAALPTASATWQRKMGEILAAANPVSRVAVPAELTENEKGKAAHKTTEKLSLFRSWRFIWANAAAAMLAIAVWMGWWMIRE